MTFTYHIENKLNSQSFPMSNSDADSVGLLICSVWYNAIYVITVIIIITTIIKCIKNISFKQQLTELHFITLIIYTMCLC